MANDRLGGICCNSVNWAMFEQRALANIRPRRITPSVWENIQTEVELKGVNKNEVLVKNVSATNYYV
jgi:transcriptional regulator